MGVPFALSDASGWAYGQQPVLSAPFYMLEADTEDTAPRASFSECFRGGNDTERALWLMFGVNSLLTGTQIFCGLLANSLSLLGDGALMAMDGVSYAVSFSTWFEKSFFDIFSLLSRWLFFIMGEFSKHLPHSRVGFEVWRSLDTFCMVPEQNRRATATEHNHGFC